MEIQEKRKALSECGPADAITISEIKSILQDLQFSSRDVFYDLGCGHGRFVRQVAKLTKVKKSIGIEVELNRFCEAVKRSKRLRTKIRNKIDFWCGYYEKFDFSNATIIYEGHSEKLSEVNTYKNILKMKRVKIIKPDLPLIAYKPIKIISTRDTKFFVMQYPLNKYKIYNKMKWASFVNEKEPTVKGVYKYYRKLLKKRDFSDSEINSAIHDLSRLIYQKFA